MLTLITLHIHVYNSSDYHENWCGQNRTSQTAHYIYMYMMGGAIVLVADLSLVSISCTSNIINRSSS